MRKHAASDAELWRVPNTYCAQLVGESFLVWQTAPGTDVSRQKCYAAA